MAPDPANAHRVNGLTYLQIPSPDPAANGEFYAQVFGWDLRGDASTHLSFSDGTGHVIGAFVRDVPVGREPGVLPYVFVDSVDVTLRKAVSVGAKVVKEPYHEPPDADDHLTVATLRDVAGNVIGIWQIGG